MCVHSELNANGFPSKGRRYALLKHANNPRSRTCRAGGKRRDEFVPLLYTRFNHESKFLPHFCLFLEQFSHNLVSCERFCDPGTCPLTREKNPRISGDFALGA